MTKELRLPDHDKYGDKAQFEVVEHFNSRMRERFHQRVRESGKSWEEAVFDRGMEITADDLWEIEKELLDTGYRYTMSAQISIVEEPDKYKPVDRMDAADGDAVASGERTEVGQGDNVTRKPENISGTARFISTTEAVMEMVLEGVPDDTIAIIDDSGGTLTAPIIEDFTGILCLGGTVRSHLAILAREYSIPCLMNVELDGLRDGDTVEVEYTKQPPQAVETGLAEGERASIWKL